MDSYWKKIVFGMFVAGFLFVLMPAKTALADCTANIQFGPPASAPFNQLLTLSSTITLGNFNTDGYCKSRTIYVYYDFGSWIDPIKNPPGPLNPLGTKWSVVRINLAPNSPAVPATVTIKPSDHAFVVGDTLSINAQVIDCSDRTAGGCSILTTSGSKRVQLTAGLYTTYACVATNGRYACSAQGANRSDCSGVPNKNTVCGASAPCVQINSALCGQPGQTHKACQDNACVSVAGPGPDTCSANANCAGAGGGTQDFEIQNPIGIDTFEELVNVIGRWIFNLAIPIAVIIIIYAGVLMLTAGGDPGRFKKGMEALKYAVIGLAVVLIGKGFVSLIQSILSLRNP